MSNRAGTSAPGHTKEGMPAPSAQQHCSFRAGSQTRWQPQYLFALVQIQVCPWQLYSHFW